MSARAIKPIETVYRGYRFRSRLEARWAVFFDALKFKWEYEPEGFVLPSGRYYLPDFRVYTPQGEPIWYEVKPENVERDELFSEFSEGLGGGDAWPRCELLRGDPITHLARLKAHESCWHAVWDDSHWGMCPRCGLVGRSAYGSARDEFGCGPCDMETPGGGGHPWESGLFGSLYTPHKGSLLLQGGSRVIARVAAAAAVARQARFEHGQVGAPSAWR